MLSNLLTASTMIQSEISDEFRKSSFHTLIVDESTDISVQKMLILYVKFRPVQHCIAHTEKTLE